MSLQAAPAATQRFIEEADGGFHGLAVQSVGYTVGDEERGEDPFDIDAEDEDEDGEPEDRPGVHIYVARGSKSFLRSLPDEIHGIPCTVHNVGKLFVKPHLSATTTNRGNLYEHDDRVACGSSCAPAGLMLAGTFGALVRKNAGGKLYALSNNHVFADCNHTSVGQPILSPAGMDARAGLRAPSEICRHSEIVELRSGAPALVAPCREDIAIAEVPDGDAVSSWQGDDEDGYDTPTDTTDPATGLRVKKFGRTTGLTFGTMQSVQVRLSLPYQSQNFRALVWFQDVWMIRSNDSDPFALGGDSGSLVVTEDGDKVVGILFATSNKGAFGIVIPIDRVLAAFGGLSLVAGHGV